jgi:hypothetical protein
MRTQSPPLADTLTMLLPEGRDRLLLRVCLADRATALAAWDAWTAATPDIAAFLREQPMAGRLLSGLHAALIEHDAVMDASTRALLNAASLAETRRMARIREIVEGLHAQLRRASVMPVLFNGVALAATAYPQPELRHCHDIDLLIPPEDLERAQAAAIAAGFTGTGRTNAGPSMTLLHRDGLPLHLHTGLPSPCALTIPLDRIRSRTVSCAFGGEAIATLHPLDSLVQLCGYAMSADDTDYRILLADAAAILRGHPDWDLMPQIARDRGDSLALFVVLDYLKREIDIPIDETVLSALARDARTATRARKDFLLSMSRRRPSGFVWTMFRHSGWRSRLEILRWMLLPSKCFLQWWCSQHGVAWTPWWYLGRPLRGLGRRVGQRLGQPAAPVHGSVG